MSDNIHIQLMSDLYGMPDAERAPAVTALVRDNNRLIADTPLPFDSTPYAFVQWLRAADRGS